MVVDRDGNELKYPVAVIDVVEDVWSFALVHPRSTTLYYYDRTADGIEVIDFPWGSTDRYSQQVENIIQMSGLDGFVVSPVKTITDVTKATVIGRIDPL